MLIRLALIAAGGAVGALARYAVSGWTARLAPSSFPYGTLLVNVVGSLALGLLMGATVAGSVSMSPRLRMAIAVGGLGAFTTFSTFAYETVAALRVGDLRNALAATALNLLLAVTACWLGVALGERL